MRLRYYITPVLVASWTCPRAVVINDIVTTHFRQMFRIPTCTNIDVIIPHEPSLKQLLSLTLTLPTSGRLSLKLWWIFLQVHNLQILFGNLQRILLKDLVLITGNAFMLTPHNTWTWDCCSKQSNCCCISKNPAASGRALPLSAVKLKSANRPTAFLSPTI